MRSDGSRTKLMALGVLACAVTGGCYRHQYVVSGVVPKEDASMSEWQHNFLWGSVSGTRDIDLREVCPEGVARAQNFVAVEHVPLHILTLGIYAPTRVEVYCRRLPNVR